VLIWADSRPGREFHLTLNLRASQWPEHAQPEP
jgi:hypothetical protein